jgi:hypothetical protein
MALDNLIVEKFIEQIEKECNRFDQLGEMEKAFMLNKCIRVISTLVFRLNEYQIPIPVDIIQKITQEKR